MEYSEYCDSLSGIPWLAAAGQKADVRTVVSIQHVFDVEPSATTWAHFTNELESEAIAAIGGQVIDETFAHVSGLIQDPLLAAVFKFLDTHEYDDELQRDVDRGLYPEMMDWIKRDMCWAGVEARIGEPGFFLSLMPWYRKGRWPCSWDGQHPSGQVVLL